jgi:hypothetical protein
MKNLLNSTIMAGCAAIGLFGLPSAQAGYFANTTATDYVWDASINATTQPWSTYVVDGNQPNSGVNNSFASSTNSGGSFAGKTLSSFAEADLSAGTLRASASLINTVSTPSLYATSVGMAQFGDSFTFGSPGGGAFDWTSGSLATFNFHLDGLSFTDTSIPQIDWSIGLEIFQPGALTASSTTPLDSLALGALNITSNLRNSGTNISGGTYGVYPVPITFNVIGGSLSTGYDITASFNPGGNFDWIISLSTSMLLSDKVGTAYSDLSHTMKVDFSAPDGSNFTSASGVFPGGQNGVPEPGSIPLIGLGIVFLAAISYRKQAKRMGA